MTGLRVAQIAGKTFLGESVKVFQKENSICIGRLSKDHSQQCGWALSNVLKTWIGQKVRGRSNLLSEQGHPSFALGCWCSWFSAFGLELNYTTCFPGPPACRNRLWDFLASMIACRGRVVPARVWCGLLLQDAVSIGLKISSGCESPGSLIWAKEKRSQSHCLWISIMGLLWWEADTIACFYNFPESSFYALLRSKWIDANTWISFCLWQVRSSR